MRRQITLRRTWVVGVAAAALVAIFIAPAGAAPGAATAGVSPGSPLAGTTGSYTYTLTPSSGQISSFNLTAPTGWTVNSVDSAPTGVALVSGVIQGRGLMITSSSPLMVMFTAQAPCAAGTVAWSTTAKTGGNFTGASVSVNDVSASVSSNCTAEFVRSPQDRQPADAAFNTNTTGPSQNITSVPYTPDGAAIQAVVKDASGAPRPGTSVTLAFAVNPTGASLGGGASLTAVSGTGGVATFDGSCSGCSPITINKFGQGYRLKAEGTGVVGTAQPDAFGVYQEGTPCDPTHSCVGHGHINNDRLTATVTAPATGTLGVFLTTDPNIVNTLTCQGFTSPFTTQAILVWKYTGDGSQTIVLDISKQMMREILDRGSDHLDFCFDSEGKPFVDKFGTSHWGSSGNNTPGLLSDCNTGIDPNNCIVSETGLNGGGREMTVTVADGHGKI